MTSCYVSDPAVRTVGTGSATFASTARRRFRARIGPSQCDRVPGRIRYVEAMDRRPVVGRDIEA